MSRNLTFRTALARLEYSVLLYGEGTAAASAAARFNQVLAQLSTEAARTQHSLNGAKVRHFCQPSCLTVGSSTVVQYPP